MANNELEMLIRVDADALPPELRAQAIRALQDELLAIRDEREAGHESDEKTCRRCAAQWMFELDDACYQVGRGVRAYALPECVVPQTEWDRSGEAENMLRVHGVHVRVAPAECTADGFVMLEIARAPIVFELVDAVRATGRRRLVDALAGLLLGYDARDVQKFVGEGTESVPSTD